MVKKGISVILALAMVLSGSFTGNASKAAGPKVSIAKNVSIYVGQKKQLTVKYKGKKINNKKMKLKWKSSSKKVATVSAKGVVAGKKPGTAVITVRIVKLGKSAKCKVKVMKKKTVSNLPQATAVQSTVTPGAATTEPTATAAPTEEPKERPRVIVTTDGEFDDANSFIHYLLYANEMDFAGIVTTSSKYHWEGTIGHESEHNGKSVSATRWAGRDWSEKILDAYEEVYSNLIIHDPTYPTPDYLREINKIGNVGYEGEMDGPTDGSNLIRDCILDDDERPLFVQCWGGENTLAMALKQIEEEYADSDEWDDIYDKVGNKVIILACSKQDDTYNNYIAKVWPNIPFFDNECQAAYGYATKDNGSEEMKRTLSGDWMYENIEVDHGPLLDMYITWGDGTPLNYEPESLRYSTNESLLGNKNAISWVGKAYYRYDFLSEGDSPTYFALLDTGLGNYSLEEFTYGGYAGRYAKKAASAADPNSWVPQNDNDSVLGLKGNYQSMMKWVPDIQHDFAARADWCVTSDYNKANHRPELSIEEGNEIEASAGEVVILNAVANDPDGDNVTMSWWNYAEAGTYKTNAPIILDEIDSDSVSFTVPDNAKSGDTIHIIARATDDGEHSLVYHQRVIVTVK